MNAAARNPAGTPTPRSLAYATNPLTFTWKRNPRAIIQSQENLAMIRSSCLSAVIIFSLMSVGIARADGDKPSKEPSTDQYSGYLVKYSHWDKSAPKLSDHPKGVASPYRTWEFLLIHLTDSKTPYEKTKAAIALLHDGRPVGYLLVRGFKNLDASWAAEDVLKVEISPGRLVQIVQLISVEDGRTLYTGAWYHDEALPPQNDPAGTNGPG